MWLRLLKFGKNIGILLAIKGTSMLGLIIIDSKTRIVGVEGCFCLNTKNNRGVTFIIMRNIYSDRQSGIFKKCFEYLDGLY